MKIRKPDDFHVHLRRGDLMKAVLPYTSGVFGRALVMPNTDPPIFDAEDARRYYIEIMNELRRLSHRTFTPLITFKIGPLTTPTLIDQFVGTGVIAGKLYPDGVTTNSENGVTDYKALYPVFEAMEAQGIVLCVHAETPGVFSLDREKHFLESTLTPIIKACPGLKIVVEHLTTMEGVEFVKHRGPNLAATITLHHMMLTLDDVIGGTLNPHAFCKPVAKRDYDRDALLHAALSGNPKFFFGSDSAPHDRSQKECCGAAGIFSAPVLMPALAQLFEENSASELDLEKFCSRNGADFYGLPLNSEYIELVEAPNEVPGAINTYGQDVVPFLAGKTLRYKVV